MVPEDLLVSAPSELLQLLVPVTEAVRALARCNPVSIFARRLHFDDLCAFPDKLEARFVGHNSDEATESPSTSPESKSSSNRSKEIAVLLNKKHQLSKKLKTLRFMSPVISGIIYAKYNFEGISIFAGVIAVSGILLCTFLPMKKVN